MEILDLLKIIHKPQNSDVGNMAYIVGTMRYPFHGAEKICKKFYQLIKKYDKIYQGEEIAKRIDGIVKNCEGGYVNLNIFRVIGRIEDARLELYKMFVELAEEEDLKYNMETWSSKSRNLKVHGITMNLF